MQPLFPRELDCLRFAEDEGVPLLHAVRPGHCAGWLASLPQPQAQFLSQAGFTAKPGQAMPLPGEGGLAGFALGVGEADAAHGFGGIVRLLPPGSVWRLAAKGVARDTLCRLTFGFCVGAYRYPAERAATPPESPALALTAAEAATPDIARALRMARAVWLVRDLINCPANQLGPAELAAIAARALAERGAHVDVITEKSVAEMYPALHAVGQGAARQPVVLVAKWAPPGSDGSEPLLSICGKGICFDTGGYDLKPAAGMLRMKKDMGGAAVALALSCLIADENLTCRFELRLACAENMISGSAMRPLDVVKTRSGLTVEIGNTDAEGRLVLCDLLAEACESGPDTILDFATLTGAARVALGPDLPALFCNDEELASLISACGAEADDPVWRLPLHAGYNSWLDSDTADLNNVSEKSHAGAIVAALFLQRFVSPGIKWAHFDIYGWNDTARPGRPAGGEAQAMMAAFAAVRSLAQRSPGQPGEKIQEDVQP